MNLARHAAVLWRFRAVTATGLVLAVLLAVLASYKLSFDGGVSLKPRGTQTWSATSTLLVTQPGFPEGRVTLPQRQIDSGTTASGQPAVSPTDTPANQLQFADPARLASLADLYSRYLTSDQVLRRVPGHPKPEKLTASPFQASAGGQVLPVIQLVTMAPSKPASTKMNLDVVNALRSVLAEGQARNGVSRAGRVEVEIFNSPDSVLTAGRKPTAAILVFLLCVLATMAVTHLLAALRARQEAPEFSPFLAWDDEIGENGRDPFTEPVPAAAARRLRQ
jgi:hypothetical protein